MKTAIWVCLALLLGIFLAWNLRQKPKIAEPAVVEKPFVEKAPKKAPKTPQEPSKIDPDKKLKEMLDFPKIDPNSIDFSPLDKNEYRFR